MVDKTPSSIVVLPYFYFLFLFFCNDLWQHNILFNNYITKSFRTHSAQAFSQLKVLVYADICIYIVCMGACTYMHNLILSYGAFDSSVQKWNFYCSYLHTCLYTVQKQQLLSLQLSLSLTIFKKRRCKHGFQLFPSYNMLLIFWWLEPSNLVYTLNPYLSLLSCSAGLQPSVIYWRSSVCLTVLLVNLIYRLVTCVVNIFHIIAELKKIQN